MDSSRFPAFSSPGCLKSKPSSVFSSSSLCSYDVAVSITGDYVCRSAGDQLHSAVGAVVYQDLLPLHAALGPAAQCFCRRVHSPRRYRFIFRRIFKSEQHGTTNINCFISSFCVHRSAWHGGSHDVHAGVSDHRHDGARRLQTSQLWLLLGLLVSSLNQAVLVNCYHAKSNALKSVWNWLWSRSSRPKHIKCCACEWRKWRHIKSILKICWKKKSHSIACR